MTNILEILYPADSRPAETIFERNHREDMKVCDQIANHVIDKLDNNVLFKLIEKGQDWAFHSMPIFEINPMSKCKYIVQIQMLLQKKIENKFGRGFSVEFITTKQPHLWLSWRDCDALYYKDQHYLKPEGSDVYMCMVKDHLQDNNFEIPYDKQGLLPLEPHHVFTGFKYSIQKIDTRQVSKQSQSAFKPRLTSKKRPKQSHYNTNKVLRTPVKKSFKITVQDNDSNVVMLNQKNHKNLHDYQNKDVKIIKDDKSLTDQKLENDTTRFPKINLNKVDNSPDEKSKSKSENNKSSSSSSSSNSNLSSKSKAKASGEDYEHDFFDAFNS